MPCESWILAFRDRKPHAMLHELWIAVLCFGEVCWVWHAGSILSRPCGSMYFSFWIFYDVCVSVWVCAARG